MNPHLIFISLKFDQFHFEMLTINFQIMRGLWLMVMLGMRSMVEIFGQYGKQRE